MKIMNVWETTVKKVSALIHAKLTMTVHRIKCKLQTDSLL
jgi:hypothetical protein